jgi:hypothetical protein
MTTKLALKQNMLLPAELALQKAEHARNCWQWKIPSRWKYEDLLNPETFKLVGDRLSPGDVITVIGELGDYDCDLRVVAADRGYCLVRPIRTWFANGVDVRDEGAKEAKVQFVPGRGFVLLSETNEPVSVHLVQHEAEDALQAYLAEKAAA